ncbi:hypothetical protein F5148DRAFT_1368755, partial [Russula earlei]
MSAYRDFISSSLVNLECQLSGGEPQHANHFSSDPVLPRTIPRQQNKHVFEILPAGGDDQREGQLEWEDVPLAVRNGTMHDTARSIPYQCANLLHSELPSTARRLAQDITAPEHVKNFPVSNQGIARPGYLTRQPTKRPVSHRENLRWLASCYAHHLGSLVDMEAGFIIILDW